MNSLTSDASVDDMFEHNLDDDIPHPNEDSDNLIT